MSRLSSRTREAGPGLRFREAQRIAEIAADAVRHESDDASVRYGRARFLKDAAWMGLDEQQAFSKLQLRRRRDKLMRAHHPDRGGPSDMATRINETYSRMVEWLDRRVERRERIQRRQKEVRGQPESDPRPKSPWSTVVQVGAIQLYAFALMAAVGYNTFFRRRK